MKKNYGLRKDFFWEEVRADSSINDYLLIFDYDNFLIFCENTQKMYIQSKDSSDK